MTAQQRAEVQKQPWTTLIEDEYAYSYPRRGRFYEALILTIGEEGFIVDLLGTKRDGIIPLWDLELLNEEHRASLQEGDHIPVAVLKEAGRRGNVVVVTGVNRGGVLVSLGRLEGFVPNSHLTLIPRRLSKDRLREAKAGLVGQTLSLVVIEASRRQRRLVLSERLADCCRCEQLLDELSEGDVRTGVVRNLTDFGAFVNLGGIDGLIHISELAWEYVNHPSDVLSVGDEITVYVLSVDRERKRVGLSLKRLDSAPWTNVIVALHIGEVIEGTVTEVGLSGAFVDISEGIEGVARVFDMPADAFSLSDLEAGDQVTVRVLEVDEWPQPVALRLEDVN